VRSWYGPLLTGGETYYPVRITVASLSIAFQIILIWEIEFVCFNDGPCNFEKPVNL
jgi:hypothetical protein